jgi:hypothetical protein
MRTGRLFFSVLALSVGFSVQSAFAQGNVCLRSQWIDNWEIVDDKTLIVTDRRDQQYKIGLVGVCAGLQQTRFSLAFESLSELSCLRTGDSIHYNDLTFGRERCTISSIESYVAPEAEDSEAESETAEASEAEG